jgi:ribosomal protein L7/L12
MNDQTLLARFNALAASIARLERKVNFILTELKLDYPEDTDLPRELHEIYALLTDGKMLGAIQAYQKLKGVSLGEAKAAVQALDIELKSRGT